MKNYTVKFQTGNSGIMTSIVKASSESQAKEQIKSRYNGNVNIISCVERPN